MSNPKPASKMFLEIVNELHTLIKEEGIRTGGKLPSERELAERLQVGRSSVREALRSLELLGLIETRRGEGTFLADFKRHQLVEVLAAFIMQQPESIQDVKETRHIHELAAIQKVCTNPTMQELPVWSGLLMKVEEDGTIVREDLIRELIVASENRLSLKIWFLLKQYSRAPYDSEAGEEECSVIIELLESLRNGDKENAVSAYHQWMNLIE